MTQHVHRCMDFDFCYHPRPAELRLIELVSQGMTSRQIGEEIHCSPRTVRNYLYVLCQSLGVHDRGSLVRRAVELGLLTIERTN